MSLRFSLPACLRCATPCAFPTSRAWPTRISNNPGRSARVPLPPRPTNPPASHSAADSRRNSRLQVPRHGRVLSHALHAQGLFSPPPPPPGSPTPRLLVLLARAAGARPRHRRRRQVHTRTPNRARRVIRLWNRKPAYTWDPARARTPSCARCTSRAEAHRADPGRRRCRTRESNQQGHPIHGGAGSAGARSGAGGVRAGARALAGESPRTARG